ncbi:serine/threonine-protein kinase [Nannocystis punicea]|uniref:Serine/threonine-protein kinase n=1 Tax=Nannocystis punicea TaxID=2995304 RepID=A0ABY7GZM8_9BACT|nr:serine/threonine-protein kinase [Nannocystis poenicansa]WAS92407.1 serine/threonine-protein kinase [Nannocystis poenicansa]
MPAPSAGCLSEDEVVEYCGGEASTATRRRVEVHIDRCGECRELVATFVRGWQTCGATALAGTEPPGPADETRVPERIGRYVVLGRLGAGGMGVVHAAYDPQLGRRVALKFLAPGIAADPLARARMVREAQAMALLAHPNVATVHDAGVQDDRVWLAMELVDGETLVAWLAARRRGWREVVAMFLAAGEGLAAAHAAGLVHRDFKADNVLVGRDGRPRVVDFGLARGEADDEASAASGAVEAAALRRTLTRPGATPGTPRYMAPEQWLGQAVDARSDEFAFCVALWEALYGEHPFTTASPLALAEAVIHERVRTPSAGARVPGFVYRALRRGLAREPERRFATMAALLAALRDDPWRRQLRRGLALGVTLALAFALGWRVVAREGAIVACTAEAGAIATVWSPGRREALAREIAASGDALAQASFAATARRIDEYAAGWARLRREACALATVDGTMDAEVHARLRGCLDELLAGLDATLEVLGTGATLGRLGGAVVAMRPPGSCREPGQLREPSAEQAEVAAVRRATLRVRLSLVAGRLDAAAAAVSAAQAAAKDRPQLRALTAIAAADVALHRSDFAAAREQLLDALHFAGAAGAYEIAAEAARGLVDVVAVKGGDVAGGRLWTRQLEMWWARLDAAPDDVRRAAIDGARAQLELAAGDEEAAVAAMQRALAIYGRGFGEHDGEVATILIDLANLHTRRGSHAAAYAEYVRALAIHERLHGAGSTYAADVRFNLGSLSETLDAHAAAGHFFREALAIYESAYGREHVEVGETWARVGRTELTRGEFAAAESSFARALALAEVDAGRAELRGVALAGLGEAQLGRGALAQALGTLTGAEAVMRAAEPGALDRAHLQFALARASWAAQRELPRALELGRAAAKTFAESPEAAPSWRAAASRWLSARERQDDRGNF